mgnify:FL=1
MTMKGIDIADWQKNLNLDSIEYDFVIIKGTQGTNYVNTFCDAFVQKAIKAGKLWGFYHFMNMDDPTKQADHFYQNCKNYFGKGIPVLDYEDGGRIGTDGAKKFLDRIYALTGVRCLLYTYRNLTKEEDWSKIAPNHALWVAQYANENQTGYQDSPWLPDGGFGAWNTCVMHQYSSHGRLSGYNGNLDLDIAFMDAAAWSRYAKPSTYNAPAATAHENSGSTADLAAGVMRGKYGNGDERKARLGTNFAAVQKRVNELL